MFVVFCWCVCGFAHTTLGVMVFVVVVIGGVFVTLQVESPSVVASVLTL